MRAVAPVSTRLAALLAKDSKGVVRDRLMLFLVTYGVVIALVLRFVIPLVPVENLALFLGPAVPMIGSLLVGAVLGFALVDERESGTWQLLRVLPVSESALALYFFSLAAAGGLISGAACAFVYGQSVENPWLFAATLVVNAMGAPVLAVFTASMASNKIEAIAMGKLANIPVALPALAFVLPAPWHLALMWSPFYWIYLGFLRSTAPEQTLRSAPLVIPDLPDAALVAIPTLLVALICIPLARRFRNAAS